MLDDQWYDKCMHKSICVLGRQPALGMAELESLYGADHVQFVGSHTAGLDVPPDEVEFSRLGGSTKLAEVITEIPSTDWKQIEKILLTLMKSNSFAIPASGKFHLGVSGIGFSVSPAKLNALGLTLKKIIRARGLSVRTVPNVDPELSTAQVYHNKLATTQGAELLIIAHGAKTVVARTLAVQDIDSYTLRDRGRPKRDARVGMLPPKLAQIIINLAVGDSKRQETRDKRQERIVLDPFCGTGVVLQEALLMGYNVYGTDLEPRMIDYTKQNLDWAHSTFHISHSIFQTDVGDATTHRWDFSNVQRLTSNVHIACETYLGRPFTTVPNRDVLEQTVGDVNLILKKFLTNIHRQLPKGTRLCLAVPAWCLDVRRLTLEGSNKLTNNKRPTSNVYFRHLPLIDSLRELGFEQIPFQHVNNSQLLYYREGQIVARELLALRKI